jgi:hypothetical protein
MAAPTATSDRTHRVHWFAGRLGEVLDDVVGPEGAQPLALGVLSAEECAETVTELDREIARLVGLRAAVIARADAVDVGQTATPVATSTSAWLRSTTVTPGSVASRIVKDAVALAERYLATGAALRAGRIDETQANVIVRALDGLPADLDPELRGEAETHLLGLARKHPADELRRLAKHLLEVVDPATAEAVLAARLAKEEAEAEKKTSFWVRSDGDGTGRGGFVLSKFHLDLFVSILERYANPTRPGAPTSDVTESRDQALGRALCELLESIPADLLPSQGGSAIAAVVTIPLGTVLGGLAAAGVDTGHQLSPGEARRLAARHGVIPAILGTKSVVLDFGRRRRLFSDHQRIALRVRHTTCSVEGCTIPAAWCQAHHMDPWAPRDPGRRPGRTDLANGTLLCGRHHRLVDRPGYNTTYRADGTTTITRIRR